MAQVKMKPVDVVLVGFGWTGAIMATELTEAGLNVVALERGPYQDTAQDASFPKVIDELAYSIRGKLFQDLSRETVTIRHGIKDVAVPYRQHGSFLLGTGVGGAGFHWNGLQWRVYPAELRLRSHYEERYGKSFIPEGMTIQDFGVTYDELEPHFTRFEDICGVSGKAGNIKGAKQEGGNPFESWRSKEFPLPPLKDVEEAKLFASAAREIGLTPFPIPSANASGPYTNPYGAQLGTCTYCGFCENYGCFTGAKASPQTTLMPVLATRANFELRPLSQVIKVNLDSDKTRATGVTYIDALGREVEQPAQMVILSAFQMHNVRLLLLSGIGKPYDPVSQQGVVGKNYAYQLTGTVSVLLKKGTHLNRFIGTGAGGQAIEEYNGDNFDHGPLGFIGGTNINNHHTGGRPISQSGLMPGSPAWGSGWKAAVQDHYQRSMAIGAPCSVMSYRDAYLDLDPTYRDAFGQPLLRMTFDWHENDLKTGQYATSKAAEIAKAMNPEKVSIGAKALGSHYDARPYQTTHNTGGAIMGSDPTTSVVNKYLQVWDVPNVFVTGASAFPQNFAYNPTGLVGALAYHSAVAIREKYLKSPGPMVPV